MLEATHTDHAPWTLVDFNDQKRGRLRLISDLLKRIPDSHIDPPPLEFPDLAGEPERERYGALKPIPDFPLD